MIIFVTGVNTGVGKTIATAAIASVWQAEGYTVEAAKIAQTGEPDGAGDAVSVAQLAGVKTHEYARYPEPLAPNLAARRANMPQVTLDGCVEWLRSLDAPDKVLLVEGAGGLLVRLADDFTLADIAAQLNAPMFVVTTLGLGSLNLAELTVREAERRKVCVLGLIGGALDSDPDLATRLNIAELPRVTGVKLLGSLPSGMGDIGIDGFADAASKALNNLPNPYCFNAGDDRADS